MRSGKQGNEIGFKASFTFKEKRQQSSKMNNMAWIHTFKLFIPFWYLIVILNTHLFITCFKLFNEKNHNSPSNIYKLNPYY